MAATKAFVATNAKGAFVREASKFRNWISRRSDAQFPAAKGRYHLYVSLACPWASRCLAALYLKRLDPIVGVSVVHPVFQRTRPLDASDTHAGWAFVDPVATPSLPGPTGIGAYSSSGATPDRVNNVAFVRDLYARCSSEPTRYTVPLLWDTVAHTIVSNESSDIVRMLNESFDASVDAPSSSIDLYPQALRPAIDSVNDWIYTDISNGVYKCGFATSQAAYDDALATLFAALDRVDLLLSQQRFLVGDVFTEADIRLFTTLVRFDAVYFVHFKASLRMLQSYANLSNYLRDIYQMAPIKRSVNMDHIKLHYYASHTHINPFGLVAATPQFDLDAPHDRARFASATPPMW